MRVGKKELLNRLREIREACEVAALPEDNNLSQIIEEIDRLAAICVDQLNRK